MKTLKFFPALPLLLLVFSCNTQQAGNKEQIRFNTSVSENASDRIDAYYFHFTARCVTCRTIEESTRNNLQSLYPQQTRAGLISFRSLNLDEDSCRIIAQKFGVSGQTLLLVKADQKINLTNEGFMYAVNKPDKFREIINEKIEFLLTR
jgi:hypothetical protein